MNPYLIYWSSNNIPALLSNTKGTSKTKQKFLRPSSISSSNQEPLLNWSTIINAPNRRPTWNSKYFPLTKSHHHHHKCTLTERARWRAVPERGAQKFSIWKSDNWPLIDLVEMEWKKKHCLDDLCRCSHRRRRHRRIDEGLADWVKVTTLRFDPITDRPFNVDREEGSALSQFRSVQCRFAVYVFLFGM